jgi:hypothetical protein
MIAMIMAAAMVTANRLGLCRIDAIGGADGRMSCAVRCGAVLRAVQLEMAPNAKVGDWLRSTYPEIAAPKMTRAIKALSRQSVVTWADLHRIGLNGVEALLHVPAGLREKLREAIIFNIGDAGKHDDGRFEPYAEPKKPKPAP